MVGLLDKLDGMAALPRDELATEAYRPSAAATPSRLLSSPLRLRVDPSLSSLDFTLLLDDEELDVDEEPVGAPVDVSSREIPRVNAASRSSRRSIHLLKYNISTSAGGQCGHSTHLDGTLLISLVNVLSLMLSPSQQQLPIPQCNLVPFGGEADDVNVKPELSRKAVNE